MEFLGLAAIWNFSPLVSGVTLLVVMPVLVSVIALVCGNFNWRNPALYLGDPALAAAVVIGGCVLRHMPVNDQRMVTSSSWQIGFALLSLIFAIVTERYGRWAADTRWRFCGVLKFIRLSYGISGIYHFIMFIPVGTLVFMSMEIVIQAIMRHEVSTSHAIMFCAQIFFWCAMALLTGQMMKGGGASTVRRRN